jgi:hypothetical protein
MCLSDSHHPGSATRLFVGLCVICYSSLCKCEIFENQFNDSHTLPPCSKVSDIWPGKIHLHTWRSATLIPFEVVSLWLNTILPAVVPLFEAFLECLFANGLAIVLHIMSSCDSNRVPFSCVFRWGNSQKSQGAMWGEWGACRTTGMLCLAKKVRISCEEWAGASAWISHTLSAQTDHQLKMLIPTSSANSWMVTRKLGVGGKGQT